jgi:hypothetical protein
MYSKRKMAVKKQNCVENIIVIYPNRCDFSRQFLIVYFLPPNIDATLLRPLNFLGSAPILCINRCTAHYSSVTFWIQFCLEQIKVIALAHRAIISTTAKR